MFGPLGADKYGEYCRDIHQSGQYLLEVINDILDMSKIEAGRIRLDRRRGAARPLPQRRHARGVGARRRQGAHAHPRHRPRHPPQGRPPRCSSRSCSTCSPTRSSSRPKAAASRFARARGGCVRIAIVDTGIGIPKDALAKLGRPFEQVESQLTKSHQGSGLGLAIAKSLTELHGGTMRIRSTLGRGHASCWCGPPHPMR